MKKLIDSFGREISYLRVSVTDRCNFRCIYCSPEDEHFCKISHQDVLRYEEILEAVKVSAQLGMTKIRITGGEPLVRKGIISFIKSLNQIKEVQDISMTTNGYYLSDYALALKKAGLNRVNISLDSLQREKFIHITGRDGLTKVLQGIDEALRLGLSPVKINVVLLKGINDDEIENFIQLTQTKPLYIRFIELMPTRSELKQINQGHFVSAKRLQEKIKPKYHSLQSASVATGYGPAVYYQLPDAKGMFGFIAAVSQHFCARCNRIRLTSEGHLRPCLFSDKEIDLKERLRDVSQKETIKRRRIIQKALQEAVQQKPFQHKFMDGKNIISNFDMSRIGG